MCTKRGPMTNSRWTLALFAACVACGGADTEDSDSMGSGAEGADTDGPPGSGSMTQAGDATSAGPAGDDNGDSGDDAGTTGGDTDDDDPPPMPDPDSEDPFGGLPTGEEQWQHVCDQGWGDPVSTAFCAGDSPPTVTSLHDLQVLLGLDFVPGQTGNGSNGNPSYSMLSHSASISARTVTPINPRAFVMDAPATMGPFGGTPQPSVDFTSMAFVRGEEFVELISKDSTDNGALRFFLFKFAHACQGAGGCTHGDRYTPTWESSWEEYTLYDGDTIGNTIFDCKQCHQPDGPGTTTMLLMREMQEHYGKWWYPEVPQNIAVVDAYREAHALPGQFPSEPYGGIPLPTLWFTHPAIPGGHPAAVPQTIHGHVEHESFGATQPYLFRTDVIDAEIAAGGSSATWDALYAMAVTGQVPPVPYWTGMITDAAELATVTAAYQNYLSGVIGKDALPDMGDVWDESVYPDVSIRPAPGLDGREIMVHMCQHCHNSSLDQNLSRARFNVELLDSLSQEVKDEAIYRLMLDDSKAGKMPPVRCHELSDAERDLVIAELEG